LNQQRLVSFKPAKGFHDFVVAGPVSRGSPDATIHHEIIGSLGYVRIEIIHQHAERCFG
jgi:hypothetical protein